MHSRCRLHARSWRNAFAIAILALVVCAPSVSAAAPAPAWTINSFATPTDFAPADSAECLSNLGSGRPPCDHYAITATDAGSLPMDGSDVTVDDTLPAGLTVRHVSLFWSGFPEGSKSTEDLAGKFGFCSDAPLRCTIPSSFFTTYGAVQPDGWLKMVIYVTVDEPASIGSLTNSGTVAGGGAGETFTSEENAIGPETPFGLTSLSSFLAEADGAPDVQAGGHPYELTTRVDLATAFSTKYADGRKDVSSIHDLKDAVVDLPLGFIGSALATPTCTLAQLSSKDGCPPDTQVGHILTEPQGDESANGPIFNVVPEQGVAAEFGFVDGLHGSHVMYANVVPSAAGYLVRVTTREIPQIQLTNIVAAFYGDPAERDGAGNTPVAMFTNPADCSGEGLTTTIHVDSWQQPGSYNAEGAPNLTDPNWVSAVSSTPPVIGCNQLQFHPTLTIEPTTTQADTPTGLNVSLKVPQSTDPSTLATPPLKKAVVTLPAGMSVDPSSASGLGSCSLAELGMSASGVPNAAAANCPESSKIGTVEVQTPLLANRLQGSVYVARQSENPFGSLIALYIVVDDPLTGIVIKLPGKVELGDATNGLEPGQIRTTFDNSPQLPFSELSFHFKEGPRAPLSAPPVCGAYSSISELTPWSAPESGPPATPSDPFDIASGCMNGFAPSFAAGTSNNQAGDFSQFSVTLSRQDGEQTLGKVSITTPPGLLGILKSVVQCPEPQAAQAACGPESLIGEASAAVGAGSEPYWVTGGKVYLTGPYNDGPFGLSIVMPTTAGPFTLTGNGGPGREIVRSSIRVNPGTGQITVVSDPLPTIIDGIPLQVKTVNVTVNRPGFMINPTDCDHMAIDGTIASTAGASVAVSSPFQVVNCANLAFKPKFVVSTQAKTSKSQGASLHVKGTLGQGQANVAKIRATLPAELPARLTTLQKACVDRVFNSNPASCPAASVVGTAKAVTPVLKSPLVGPAYLVSHGGAAFPDLVIVLQGEGITLDLDGNTSIKKGITSSTFNSVPDAPVDSFEVTLPEGPHSVLATNLRAKAHGNMCGQNLKMPTTLTGQNGAVFTQTTKIAVTGCPKRKAEKKVKKASAGRHGRAQPEQRK